ncbi:hypothetical protein B0T10DRAFT_542379 [Thelonectria olida]|uniref:Uncharacterized protein n=1 Tax=Thelonectria olida TaxID=1576542 RepID=A0A9P8WIA7_9HYPO|nr:hypothetical protein B0T10DRAFT_542379 [Thelonectria olida]
MEAHVFVDYPLASQLLLQYEVLRSMGHGGRSGGACGHWRGTWGMDSWSNGQKHDVERIRIRVAWREGWMEWALPLSSQAALSAQGPLCVPGISGSSGQPRSAPQQRFCQRYAVGSPELTWRVSDVARLHAGVDGTTTAPRINTAGPERMREVAAAPRRGLRASPQPVANEGGREVGTDGGVTRDWKPFNALTTKKVGGEAGLAPLDGSTRPSLMAGHEWIAQGFPGIPQTSQACPHVSLFAPKGRILWTKPRWDKQIRGDLLRFCWCLFCLFPSLPCLRLRLRLRHVLPVTACLVYSLVNYYLVGTWTSITHHKQDDPALAYATRTPIEGTDELADDTM